MSQKNSKPVKRIVKETRAKYRVPRVVSIKEKAEIVIPEDVLQSAVSLAQQMRISLSELYTAAVSAYVSAHQPMEVTALLDQVYAAEPSEIDPHWLQIQASTLKDETW